MDETPLQSIMWTMIAIVVISMIGPFLLNAVAVIIGTLLWVIIVPGLLFLWFTGFFNKDDQDEM